MINLWRSDEEFEDARHREELDRLREDGRKKFAQEINERVDGLRGAMRSVKGELFAKGALSLRHSFTFALADLRLNLQMASLRSSKSSSRIRMSAIFLRTTKPSLNGHEYRGSHLCDGFCTFLILVLTQFILSISLASTVFHHFVASDTASESFANMKRIHGLMPYFMLKTALKISNPVAMIRGKK